MDYFLGGTRKPRENKFGACVGSRETGFWFAIGPGARGLVALLNLADLGVLRLAPFVAKPLGATLLIGRNSGWNRIQCVCVQDPACSSVCVYYCRTYYKAVRGGGEEESGRHVL